MRMGTFRSSAVMTTVDHLSGYRIGPGKSKICLTGHPAGAWLPLWASPIRCAPKSSKAYVVRHR